MTRRSPLPAHVVGAAFHVRDTAFHDASPSRLRAADLQRPFTAVRSLDLDLARTLDRCRAYEPLLREGEAFSHQTAAELHGVPLPAPSAAVHVLAPPAVSQPRTKGVIGHRSTRPVGVVLLHGLPVVSAPVVWCQLAASLSRPDLVAAGDALVTGARRGDVRGPGLASIRELAAAVGAWGGGRGARALAWALPRVRVGAESRPETLTRLLLAESGLPEPLLNHPTTVGDRMLHPDLKYPQWRIVFEYEGDGHRTDRVRWQRDIRRHRDFEAAGWRVVRVTAHDLFVDRDGFIARIRALIALIESAGG